ncbi:hypothetical protein [Roseivivax isoporae]|uniref:Uncharacterized protein n=1 Tax=Roseivivax isoporae LMG 25204 TaxID=1449351 RepID=X7FAX8_9RHOB|nr:hypothetical protein [Roseivivax isoporae]ETX29945.1 hypothetical protein RISW2_20050 [Roseivivax isoporae LMG 25204]
MLTLIGLVVAFVLVAVLTNRATRACRWREYRHSDTESTWTCVQCGARTTGIRGRAPETCLRDNA